MAGTDDGDDLGGKRRIGPVKESWRALEVLVR